MKKQTEIFYEFCYKNKDKIVYKPPRLKDLPLSHSIYFLDEESFQWFKDNCLENGKFTLNKLIPTPKILTVVVNPIIVDSVEELMKMGKTIKKKTPSYEIYDGLLEYELLVIREGNKVIQSIITKKCSLMLIEKYGCNNRNEWRVKNWGCSRDVSDVRIDDSYVSFSTLFSPPTNYVIKLIQSLPLHSKLQFTFQELRFNNRGRGIWSGHKWNVEDMKITIDERKIFNIVMDSPYHRFFNKRYKRYEIGYRGYIDFK